MNDYKIYSSDGQELKLQKFDCEVMITKDYDPPPALEEMGIASISFSFTMPKQITYEQYRDPIGYLIYCDDYKQAKTHRKSRINKKWAKRYGYVLTRKEKER